MSIQSTSKAFKFCEAVPPLPRYSVQKIPLLAVCIMHRKIFFDGRKEKMPLFISCPLRWFRHGTERWLVEDEVVLSHSFHSIVSHYGKEAWQRSSNISVLFRNHVWHRHKSMNLCINLHQPFHLTTPTWTCSLWWHFLSTWMTWLMTTFSMYSLVKKNRLLTFLQALFVDCQGTLLSLLAFAGLDACVLPCAETW